MSDFQPRFFFYLYSHRIFFLFFVAFFFSQVMFWKATEKIKPQFDIVPPAPNEYVVAAASLGDEEFLFRVLSTRLQNSGDVFAGFVSLSKYNYSRIYDWLSTLDKLNPESNFAPAIASSYYSQTQNKPDTKYIVQYLDEHASRDLDKKWKWIYQAIYIARNSMKDMDKALELSYKLSKNKDDTAPIWTKQMPAFIHEQRHEDCKAYKFMKNIIKKSKSGEIKATIEDLNHMENFTKTRLFTLKNNKFDPSKCKI